jgi:type I restriction enzyme S subunit
MTLSVPLGEVCAITMGQAPAGSSYNENNDGLPLVAGAGDFAGSVPKVKKFTTAPGKVSEPGDIILGIRASIGERVWSDKPYCLGRGVAGLRPSERLDRNYLWHWLGHSSPMLAAKGRGATFLQVNRADICEMEIPLLPLEAQRRIAAILDHADALRLNRTRILARLDDLAESIFVELFGEALGGNGISDVELVPLSAVVHRITYGFTNPMTHVEAGIPIVTAKSIRDRRIDLRQGKFTTELEYAALSDKSRPQRGDLLITKDGTIGRCAVVSDDAPFCINQSVALVRPNLDLVQPDFLVGYFGTRRVQAKMNGMGKGNALKHLQITELAKMLVPYPRIEAQEHYAVLMDHVRRLQEQALEVARREEGLKRSLQAQAFGRHP